MGWQRTYDEQTGVVTTVYAGQLSVEQFREAIADAVAGLAQGRRLFLTDCTGLELGPSTLAVFDQVQGLEADGLAGHYREAVLLPAGAVPARDVEFWETACRNRGMDVRIFEERDQALAWLADRLG